MKANVRDQYDFEQLSPSQKPGFELFFSDKYKAWFFHANDVRGKPILFSQAYQTAENAEKGMQSALKNIEKGRIYKRIEGGQYFLSVVAGNHQEVGRSFDFEDEKETENTLSFLKQVANASNPMISTASNIETVEQPTSMMDDKPIRSYFRIYFYKNSGDGNPLNGRIEDITDENSGVSFQGIDTQAIIGFIRQKLGHDFEEATQPEVLTLKVPISTPLHIPTTEHVYASKGVTVTSTVSRVVSNAPQTIANAPVPPHKPSGLRIRPVQLEGQVLSIEKRIYNRTTPSVKMLMTFSDALGQHEGRIIGSEIVAHDAQTQHITRLQSVETDRNNDKGNITFGFSPSNLPASGTYRLEATAWLTGVNQEVVNLKGTCWAYFL